MGPESRHRIDRCDALDLLEEAVLLRRVLTIRLEGGEEVTGRPIDVVTAHGQDLARLEGGRQIDVGRIVRIERDGRPTGP